MTDFTNPSMDDITMKQCIFTEKKRSTGARGVVRNRESKAARGIRSCLLQALVTILSAGLFAFPARSQTGLTLTVDIGVGQTGLYTSQVVVNGNPAIAYFDSTHGRLLFTRNSAVDGSGTWTIVSVDSVGYAGEYLSLAIVNGNPAISYSSGGLLKYVRATDANGMVWGAPVSVNHTSVGYTSLAIVNGNPAIGYLRGNNGANNLHLEYVRATDANGAAWGTPVTVDGTSDLVGEYVSLAIVNGMPAMGYYDKINGTLKYVHAADASGTVWGTPLTLAGMGDVGQYISLVVVNGNPAISYFDQGLLNLKYVRATDADGTTWGPLVTISHASFSGRYLSMTIVNGNPAVSYLGYSDLFYQRATDANGTAWGTAVYLGTNGSYTSMIVVNGNPAVSYAGLGYVRATDANGTAWGPPTILDGTSGRVGRYAALAIVKGNPAISYEDGYRGLSYVRAINASGTAWGTPVRLGGGGWDTSLAVVNGNPAIGYIDSGNSDLLKYVRATNVNGTAWASPLTLDSAVGLEDVSLAVVNGNPAISYNSSSNGHPKYVRATDASGTAWGTPVILDTDDSGTDTSLAIVNGNPAISYFDGNHGRLKYVRATDASGATWGAPVIVDLNSKGRYTSLAVVNGNPAISYYDLGNSDLKYIRAADANGATWGAPITPDGVGDVGQYTSLAVVNGNPAISYYDSSNGDLKYVCASNANGTAWGAPVVLDSLGDVGQYTSLAMVNGNPAVSYYDAANYALKFAPMANAAELVLVKSVNNTAPLPGGVVAYTLTLVNHGPNVAGSVAVTDRLPANAMNYVSDSGGGAYDAASGVWAVGALLPNARASLTINAALTNDPAVVGVTVTNTASITASDAPDGNLANNSASAILTPYAFGIGTVAPSNQEVQLNVQTQSGHTYYILGTNDFAHPGAVLTQIVAGATSFSFADPSFGSSTQSEHRFYQVVDATAGQTNPTVFAVYSVPMSTSAWYKLSYPADVNGQNRLDQALGTQLKTGLYADDLNGDRLFVLDTAGHWDSFKLDSTTNWTTNVTTHIVATNSIPETSSFWVKRMVSGVPTNVIFSGTTRTGAYSLTFRSNDWHMIAWPFATPRAEGDGGNGWGFAAAGAQTGLSWLNADNLIVGNGVAQQVLWLKSDGRWYLLDGSSAAAIKLEAGEGYYYLHRGSGFTWTVQP